MAIVKEYPHQTKKSNKAFFKKMEKERTPLDWAATAGWWETDGSFFKQRDTRVSLNLRDREPVEIFSKTFKVTMCFLSGPTTTPNGKKYMSHMYSATMYGEKARWFTKHVYPYLIKQSKKDVASKVLGYRPESKDPADWTPDEVRNYMATAMDGDGTYEKRGLSIQGTLYSSDPQYLSDVTNLVRDKLEMKTHLQKFGTYMTQKGPRVQYGLRIRGSWRANLNIAFFQSLPSVMTLSRKKEKVQEFLNNEKKF